ncbi:MAG: universal stress protein [Bacteroidetes bacterium]|jgi:hypothetical protein|nr:universal stress protein [Bacteroidota bacterium]
MKLRCIASEGIIDHHSKDFVHYIKTHLKANLELKEPAPGWERSNAENEWLISSTAQFLNADSIRNYWLQDQNSRPNCGPHIVIPEEHPPSEINNLLLAYSSYPDVEKSFLRLGMDSALRLQANLHCLKIVQPPQVLWSHRQYPISRKLKGYETVSTNSSISRGVLDYAKENQIDLICLLTRPWTDVLSDLSLSHSYKILNNSPVPVMLYREDDVMEKQFKVGA